LNNSVPQKSLFFRSSFSYLIPIILLICSFAIYSYNLEGQPWYIDEVLHLAWGGINFDLIKEGDLNNPCLKNISDCELVYSEGRGMKINYTPIRNFFVGFSQYFTTGENKGDFYQWSCIGHPCWDSESIPSPEEFSSGRFFSSIFGSLTIVLAFFIGKTLFNRTVGLFFALILLFYSLWIMHSRLIMSEVYLHFFILLSIFLLLKSFNKENNYRVPFFIFGAISFGIALNIKIVAIEWIIPILVIIIFYNSCNDKLNFRFFKNKKNILKIISLVFVFFLISSVSFVATFPKFYDNTLNQIGKIRSDAEDVGFSSPPTTEKNYFYRTYITFQVTLFPYLMDSYIYDIFPDEADKIKFSKPPPANYSTIPITLFFFIGLIYMIKNIKTGNLKFSEFVLLVWFASLFIFSVLTVDYFHVERYYLPTMFPIILIASYGLWRFIKQIQNKKGKILFSVLFLTTHSLYLIPFLDKIYYSSGVFIVSPLPVSSQLSLNEPIVYLSSLLFVMIFVLIFIGMKIGVPSETKQAQ